jgi:hypothetical protein
MPYSAMHYHIIPGHVFFIINNLLVLNLSFCLALLIMGRRELWRQILAAIANFALLVYAVVLVTGIIGYLNPLAVAVILCLITVLLLPAIKTHLHVGPTVRCSTDSQALKANNYGLIFYISLALLAGIGSIWAFRALFMGTYFIWDDLSYHAFIPAQWLVEGKIALAPYPYQTYYPYNAELLSLWFMLPYYNDAFVSITALYWGTLSATAMFSIVYLLTRSVVSSCITAVLFLASGSIQETLHTFSSVDLAGPATALAALAFAYGEDSSSIKDRIIDFLYCGLLAGFAAGTKISLIPIIPILILYLVFRHRRMMPIKSIIFCCSLFMTGAVLTGGFWYIRNLILVGNPLFPAEFGPFKGPFSASLQYNSTLIAWILKAPFNVNQNLFIIKNLLHWPLSIGLVSVLGYLGALFYFISRKETSLITTVRSSYRYTLFIAGLILFILFPLTPFSGTHEEPNSFFMVHNRYIIFTFSIGLILFGSFIGGSSRTSRIGKALSLLAFISAWSYDGKMTTIFLLAALTGMVLWWRFRCLFFKPLTWLAVIAAIVLCLLPWYQYKRDLTDENIFAWCDTCYMEGKNLLPAGRAWRQLEKLPQGSRIGFLSSVPVGNAQYYPAFGRSLQFIPLPLKGNGSLQQPLHITWDWLGLSDLNRAIDPVEFLHNLEKEKVQYFIMTHDLFTDTWPGQKKILEKSKKAHKIYDDGFSIIWKIA